MALSQEDFDKLMEAQNAPDDSGRVDMGKWLRRDDGGPWHKPDGVAVDLPKDLSFYSTNAFKDGTKFYKGRIVPGDKPPEEDAGMGMGGSGDAGIGAPLAPGDKPFLPNTNLAASRLHLLSTTGNEQPDGPGSSEPHSNAPSLTGGPRIDPATGIKGAVDTRTPLSSSNGPVGVNPGIDGADPEMDDAQKRSRLLRALAGSGRTEQIMLASAGINVGDGHEAAMERANAPVNDLLLKRKALQDRLAQKAKEAAMAEDAANKPRLDALRQKLLLGGQLAPEDVSGISGDAVDPYIHDLQQQREKDAEAAAEAEKEKDRKTDKERDYLEKQREFELRRGDQALDRGDRREARAASQELMRLNYDLRKKMGDTKIGQIEGKASLPFAHALEGQTPIPGSSKDEASFQAMSMVHKNLDELGALQKKYNGRVPTDPEDFARARSIAKSLLTEMPKMKGQNVMNFDIHAFEAMTPDLTSMVNGVFPSNTTGRIKQARTMMEDARDGLARYRHQDYTPEEWNKYVYGEKSTLPTPTSPKPQPAPGSIKMRDPKGVLHAVPADQVEEAIKHSWSKG